MMMTSSAAVLCENPGHVLKAIEKVPDASIVALTPECSWFCQQHNIAYIKLGDFYSAGEINTLADELIQRQYYWAEWADRSLGQIVPEFAKFKFTPARAHLYFIKRSVDCYVRQAFILREFLSRAKPKRLIVFARSPYYFPYFEIPMTTLRPFFPWLAPHALNGAAAVEIWPDDSESEVDVTLRRGISAIWGKLTWKNAKKVFPKLVEEIWHTRAMMSAHHACIASSAGYGYDIRFVVPLLLRQGIAVLRYGPSLKAQWLSQHAQEIECIKSVLSGEFKRFINSPESTEIHGSAMPELHALIMPFIEHWLLEVVPHTWAEFLGAREWLKKNRIDAVYGADSVSTLTLSILMAAESLDITRVLNIHTPPGGAADFLVQDAIGPIQSDLFLVNGLGDVDYFDSVKERLGVFKRAATVPVGSATLNALTNSEAARNPAVLRKRLSGKNGRKPLILYIPTQLRDAVRYFCEGEISDVAYFEMQQRILKCFAEFQNVQLLYKAFPFEYTKNPIGQFISRFVPNGQIVWAPLTDVMWAVDAIVTDFVSTAVAEVVMTDKPIIVYAGQDWSRMLPRAKAALEKRAWVSENPDEFERHVMRFLSEGCFAPIKNPDNEFRELYCTYLDDKQSAKRSADVVLKAAMKRR